MRRHQFEDVKQLKISELAGAILEMIDDPDDGDEFRIIEMLEEILRRSKIQESTSRILS